VQRFYRAMLYGARCC